MQNQIYTVQLVADRLEQAAHTMRRMASVKVRGYASSWPDVVNDFNESYGYNTSEVRLGSPSSRHISEMDEACRWLLWLEKDEAKTVWLRSSGAKWKRIAAFSHCSIRKSQMDYKIAIIKIAENLKKFDGSFAATHSLPYQKELNTAYAL